MRGLYLPHQKLSVVLLAEFTLPPMSTTSEDYKIPSDFDFFSEDDDHSDLESLTEMTVPPPIVIGKLLSEARQRYLDGAESIRIPWTGQLFPLWVLDLWSEFQLIVKPKVEQWVEGIQWLMRPELQVYRREVKETLQALNTLAWTATIPQETLNWESAIRSKGHPMESFTRYLSREWFSSIHMDQMLDLLLYDIQKKRPAQKFQMMTNAISSEILLQYRKNPRDYNPNEDHFLQRFGKSLEDGGDIAGIFHVHDNHWVGAVLELIDGSIEFGDPGGGGEDDVDVCAALQWFTNQHVTNPDNNTFSSLALPCTQQQDSYNCGLYAPNALAHKFLPAEYKLFSDEVILGDLGRLEILRRLITKLQECHVRCVPLQLFYMLELTTYFRDPHPSPSPSTPPPHDHGLSRALRQLSVSPRKPKDKRRKVTVDSDEDSPEVLAPIFTRKPAPKNTGRKMVGRVVGKPAVKKPTAAQVKKEKRLQALKLVRANDYLSDHEPSTSGRPRSDVMDHLTVEVESKSPTSRAYRCAGPGCPKVFNPRTVARVLQHSKRCTKLTSAQRQYASQRSAATSPGARAEELSKGLAATDLEPSPPPVEFFGSAGAKQVREHHGALLDLAIVKLFSAAGLPPRLADYPEWKELLLRAAYAGPRYIPAGRTILMDNHVMSEQERVRGLQIAYLKTQRRLNISADGGDLRSGETFYTVHASTHEGRSFLLEGVECTLVSHTAEWIADMMMEVMQGVGIERFIAVSSDNTGNTRGSRRILCERISTMLNLPDPNHHLNNMIKDILKIPFFKLTIKILRTTVKTFNQSKQAKGMLKGQRLLKKTGRGLETIGKTRFATVTRSGISVMRNINPIRTLCTNGSVEIKKYNDYFIENTAKTLDFEMKLRQLIAVTEGASRAISCLEAAACNPGDVYLLWLALTAHLKAALASSLPPEDVCDEIRGIVNHRWTEFFVTNPGHDAYLATFYLNPKYRTSQIFKQPNAVASATITIPGTRKPRQAPIGVQHAKTFFAVGEYLFEQATTEIESGVDPVLIAFKKKRTIFAEKFKSQFTAYAQGAFPFNAPLGELRPIKWWQDLEGSEHGGIIASLALKLYSAVPHSMADERTVSVLTWMNPALRNLEKVNTVFSFAQIRGWYRDQAKQKALAEGTTKPQVKFYNIERDILGNEDSDEDIDEGDVDDIVDSDDEFHAAVGAVVNAKIDWLDEPQQFIAPSDSLDLDSEVDLQSAVLRDILADGPISESRVSTVGAKAGYALMEDEDEDDTAFAPLTW
ncbi:ribonuclease H-like domain-containing protein [Mycena galericulata]|nr:ribonuclease H-like domain-containing protein [Mycena galericulata]